MIYRPAEDSFLLEKEVEKLASGKKVLDVGTGSGILAQAAWKVGAKQVLAVDISRDVVEALADEEFEVIESDLLGEVYGKFDLIVFNPPYLPRDEREDSESALVTSGGKKGDEIIVRFLREVGDYLASGGMILLLVSSLTPLDEIEKVLRDKKFFKKIVASKKIFMEELRVWEITGIRGK